MQDCLAYRQSRESQKENDVVRSILMRFLSRIQFAFTTSFHIVFPAMTIALVAFRMP